MGEKLETELIIGHAYVRKSPLQSQQYEVWRAFRLVKPIHIPGRQQSRLHREETPATRDPPDLALCISSFGCSSIFFIMSFNFFDTINILYVRSCFCKVLFCCLCLNVLFCYFLKILHFYSYAWDSFYIYINWFF